MTLPATRSWRLNDSFRGMVGRAGSSGPSQREMGDPGSAPGSEDALEERMEPTAGFSPGESTTEEPVGAAVLRWQRSQTN